MEGPLLDFFRAARSAGLRISPAESIDATRAAQVVGFADREQAEGHARPSSWPRRWRRSAPSPNASTCSSSAATSPREPAGGRKRAGRQPRRARHRQGGGEGEGGGGGGGQLAQMLLAGDQAALAAAVEQAAAEAGLSNIALFTQVNLFTRRILERMGLQRAGTRHRRGAGRPSAPAACARAASGCASR